MYRETLERAPSQTPYTSQERPHSQSMSHPSASENGAPPAVQTPSRAAHPMSLSSIMDSEPAPPHAAPEARRASRSSNTQQPAVKSERVPSPAPQLHAHNDHAAVSPATPHPAVNGNNNNNATTMPHVSHAQVQAPNVPQVDDKDVEAELVKIESMDVDNADIVALGEDLAEWKSRGQKRKLDLQNQEDSKRKRRRNATTKRVHDNINNVAIAAKERYMKTHVGEAWRQVQEQEIADEKERKKDMQRKRRREKTLANEELKRQEALERATHAADADERERAMREVSKHEKKVKMTNSLLQGGTPSTDIREVTPHGPNLEGGTMSSFAMSEDGPSKKKGGRQGARPRKSKEQKQAEKDLAAAAHAAQERGDDLPVVAPRDDNRPDNLSRVEMLKRDRSATEDSTPPGHVPFVSPAYNQIYEQIWRDISKKDAPKVYRMKDNSLATKQSNLRKTAQLASKEARRWQIRTNKSTKDVQARAKRGMREMLSFWRRNERDERDQRKMAERQELENAKKAEADREANRQKRKLNFLISQTELYSHFIGKKVRTADIERSTDDVAISNQKIQEGAEDAHTIDLPPSDARIGTKVTNFEDLDFDDEGALHEAAMANAQSAVQAAQDKARAFNKQGEPDDGQLQSQFDDGEMNFQNPSSLQSIDIAQPKMLSCQLKEYQIKGLNWLVNLYEQGINGILADEMGLGKTVQSISVMAYLAETHNIWGPFLVIAPASTLHNWQQEIAKFVPTMKVLPYWGNAKDRKILRKYWDRKHITYQQDAEFHVLVTSYQLVVQDTQYFQKMKWQYMILDEAQAIKSSNSSRWKSLLNFHCRNRLLLTGTPIQNNMQELWALLHFIMPSLFDSHDEFSEWFSKDIESHAQSNTKLNEDQLKRLHMILKPFMLRRIKKHVQKELGDKIEKDIFCDLAYRQRAYYTNLRSRISLMDLIEKATGDSDNDQATLMNLVMQFRKVCNHPDLFERADTSSPMSFSYFAETASFMREGPKVDVAYSVRNLIEYRTPRLVYQKGGRLDLPGPDNETAGWRGKYLHRLMNIWTPEYITDSAHKDGAFSWLRFADTSAGEAASMARNGVFERAVGLRRKHRHLSRFSVWQDEEEKINVPTHAMFDIVSQNDRAPLAEITTEGRLHNLLNVSKAAFEESGFGMIEQCAAPAATAPPIEIHCSSQRANFEKQESFFNLPARTALYSVSEATEHALVEAKMRPSAFPTTDMLPVPANKKQRYTNIHVPSMRRFVTDSGKLAQLDALLRKLKEDGHRVLLYFQMTRMIDLMEEYLTYRNYKYCRLDGSTKLEDRRDTVADFQTRPEIFVFLLSTRAGGLGINLTSADTVIFYDSDWNPTIDSQAMDRAHRLGQTKQVTVYRLITRGTIEERIRKRALQKEEVQRVVISGGAGAQVDFNTRSRENRTKDIAMWLADDDQAAEIEKKEAELAKKEAEGVVEKKGKKGKAAKKKDVSLDDMYHEGEGHFDDASAKPSGAATPIPAEEGMPGGAKKRGKGMSKKAKTIKQRLAIADGGGV
ncbi:putative DNA helicase INO80 [Aulographum hederae CBS 113979]|uniref:Chromatin-remodeling ATPase INO80 n=1 Tax=Aulographum hederae CBS 113979 TaxID=1176131 RepID=A0A6G1GYX3_9PEZI|nr:putative DNA helicase INO80 [Aulographum hederae CBS 113979]